MKTRFKPKKTLFWALRDVSFDVERGESLGIIGHNGAGKSTILKLLSNVTTPSEGEIAIRGRLSALLEVGSGFHPELTGRENIYLSGSLLGMSRREITEKLEEIIDFADMQKFIDSPSKRYSSGMLVRLGFSIAAHINPDILLLDEVLAVGDIAFQEKCKKRIAEMHEEGTTLVFISHDLSAVRTLCQRVILLQQGQIRAEGAPDEMIREYVQSATFHQRSCVPPDRRAVNITNVVFYDSSGERSSTFSTGQSLSGRVDYIVERPIAEGSVSLFFYASDGSLAAQWTTALRGPEIAMHGGPGAVEFRCAELGLQPDVYQIDAIVEESRTKLQVEWQTGCTSIHVEPALHVRGAFYMPHTWKEVSPQLDQ
ncbi:MAG: ABC transporter ATP-binding protein [Acidobacteriaceae bacterium]|nr:ABC transporter ATP-binding protein [Acidobacteriaceae bacterium]